MAYLGVQKYQQYNEMTDHYNETVQQNEQLQVSIEQQTSDHETAEVDLQKALEDNAEKVEVYQKWEKYNQKLIDLLP